jgi:hypothetical protein
MLSFEGVLADGLVAGLAPQMRSKQRAAVDRPCGQRLAARCLRGS